MAGLKRRLAFGTLALALAWACCGHAAAAKPKAKVDKRPASQEQSPGFLYASRPDAMQMADSIAERRNLDPVWVRQAIGSARNVPRITRWVLPPAVGTAKNWRVYRSRFIDPVRIAAGVQFWNANAATLERAETEFGVPAEIVVGIIGVETIYGRDTGNFRVMDALATLSFDFPHAHPRAAQRRQFFQDELEQLLSLANRSGSNPLDFKGSYAGAMGLPQFMPSSWVRYAIDYDGDGKVDLFSSRADAIGSVANYFKAFGWQPGMPTHFDAQFDASRLDLDSLLAPDILPTFSAAALSAKGVVLNGQATQHRGLMALVELQNGDAPASYVIGTENFYAITRYNWSSYYAMAVIELGREVAAARRR